MVDKNKKNFLTRGEEAARERDEGLKEYTVDRREEIVMREAARRAELAGNLEEQSLHLGVAASAAADAAISARKNAPHIEAIEKQFRRSTRVATGTRAVTSDIARHANSTANYGIASEIAANSSTSQIQQEIQDVQNERFQLRQKIIKSSQIPASKQTPEQRAAFSAQFEQFENLARREGIAKSSMAIQRRQGTDLASVYESTIETLKRNRERSTRESIVDDVVSGKAGSVKDIREDFDKKLKELASSFDELRKVTNDTTATLEDKDAAERKHKKAAEEYAQAEIKEAAARRMGPPNRLGGAMQGIGHAGAILEAGGGMYRQWTKTQELDRINLQTGFVGIANRRFFDNVSASQGDAAAILRIRGSQHAKSAAKAAEIGGDEVIASKAEAGGSGLLALAAAGTALLAAGKIATSTVIGAKVGIPLMALGGALTVGAASAGGISRTSGQVAKLESGAVEAAAEIEGYSSVEEYINAKNAQQAYVNQVAIDYTRGSYLSTRGAGSGRSGLLKEMRSTGFVKEMAGLEIDLAGMASLSQAGVGSLGRQFRGAEDMRRAGELSVEGLVSSPEEYMQLRATSERGGVGAGGLDGILSKAVAAGLDQSKHINELVQGIDSLATTRGGVSTFGGAAENMLLVSQAMRSGGMSETMIPRAAADMSRSLSDAAASTGLTIQNVEELAALREAFPDMEFAERHKILKLRPEEYRTILSAIDTAPDGGASAKAEFGLEQSRTREDVAKMMNISAKQAMSTTIGYGTDIDKEEKIRRIVSGEEEAPALGSKEDTILRTHINRMSSTPISSKTPLSAYRGIFDSTAAAKPETETEREARRLAGEQDAGHKILTAGATGQATAFEKGLEGLAANVKTMSEAALKIDPANFKTVIDASAGVLGATLDALNKSVEGLNMTVDNLNGALGGKQSGTAEDSTKAKLEGNVNRGQRSGFGGLRHR